jgi:hypothetical protein
MLKFTSLSNPEADTMYRTWQAGSWLPGQIQQSIPPGGLGPNSESSFMTLDKEGSHTLIHSNLSLPIILKVCMKILKMKEAF